MLVTFGDEIMMDDCGFTKNIGALFLRFHRLSQPSKLLYEIT